MIFRLEMHLTAASGRRIIHRGYFVAQNQGAAEAKCAQMMVAYQPATGLQVSKVFVQGQEIAYEMLRPAPSGILQSRLIISAASAHMNPHCRAGRIQIAVSDPVPAILDYVEQEGEPPPETWANFLDGFLGNLCDVAGNGFYKVLSYSFAERPRQADMGPPTDDRASNVWRDYMIYHGGSHLSGGNDVIQFVRTRIIYAPGFWFDGTTTSTADSVCGRLMEYSSDRNCFIAIDLNDYVSGEMLVQVWHRAVAAGAGNVRHRVRGRCIADGSGTVDTFDTSINAAMRADLNIQSIDVLSIPAASLTRGTLLVMRVGRVGTHAEDTFTKNTVCVAVVLKYLSDLVPPS